LADLAVRVSNHDIAVRLLRVADHVLPERDAIPPVRDTQRRDRVLEACRRSMPDEVVAGYMRAPAEELREILVEVSSISFGGRRDV